MFMVAILKLLIVFLVLLAMLQRKTKHNPIM